MTQGAQKGRERFTRPGIAEHKGVYVPRVDRSPWGPDETIADRDGAEAAWLIVQHAIGEPEFQRDMLHLLNACAGLKRVPPWHAAYLEDRIAMYEGRPQVYGTQWIDDPRYGRIRPWSLAEPDRINELRAGASIGQCILSRNPARNYLRKNSERSRTIGSGGSTGWQTGDGGVLSGSAGWEPWAR
jgi:hypothetical protein